jgi:hypothetical protein
MRELGQFEALTCTRHFVNREILRTGEGLQGKERERVEMSMGNADFRQSFENKTLQEIQPGVESPFMTEMRDKIRAEEIAKIKDEKKEVKDDKPKVIEKVKDDKKSKEFAD